MRMKPKSYFSKSDNDDANDGKAKSKLATAVQIANKSVGIIFTNIRSAARNPMVVTLSMAVLLILVSSTSIFAAKDLKTVVDDFSKFIYQDIRFAVCILGLAFAGVRFWSKDDNGRRQAFFIMIGVGIIAFAPGLINYIANLTGTTTPTGAFN